MLLQSKSTALHLASIHGKVPSVEVLVRAGSDLAAVDEVSAGLSPRAAGVCGSNTCIGLEFAHLHLVCCFAVLLLFPSSQAHTHIVSVTST